MSSEITEASRWLGPADDTFTTGHDACRTCKSNSRVVACTITPEYSLSRVTMSVSVTPSTDSCHGRDAAKLVTPRNTFREYPPALLKSTAIFTPRPLLVAVAMSQK